MKKILLLILYFTFLFMPLQINAKMINMGDFKLTAYCPCQECSEGWGRQTRSGRTAMANRTVAADLSVMNLGDKITINGEEFVVEDCGGSVHGDHIDIFMETHEEVEAFGVRWGSVIIWR